MSAASRDTSEELDGRYSSQVSLRKAISSSLNIPAVEVLNDISVRAGMKFASNVGIEFADNDKSLALALGDSHMEFRPCKSPPHTLCLQMMATTASLRWWKRY